MRINLFCAVASPVFVVAINMASNLVCSDDREKERRLALIFNV